MHVPLDRRVETWFAACESDLRVAESIREAAPHLACFHAQQGAERALKALVTRLSGDAPAVHAMERLLEALRTLAEIPPPDVQNEAESLDKYYVPPRYPDALGFVDASLAYKPRDADAALASARIVLAWASAREATLREAGG